MPTNLFPAILLAGPPNSGKSVLSYLLTMKLRELGIDHYLMRAAPDGEGDWFLQGNFAKVQPLRLAHKGKFTEQFVRYMIARIQARWLPLLVDVGGAPQDEQWEILRACTHSVLLYKTSSALQDWRTKLAQLELLPVAELRSELDSSDRIWQTHPVLQGSISGLGRKTQRTGRTFWALLDRVAGISHYSPAYLEEIHLRGISFPVVNERLLAERLQIQPVGGIYWWPASKIRLACELIPAGKRAGIYGRGPVWLAAALAVRILPEEAYIFDATGGWLPIPGAAAVGTPDVNVQVEQWDEGRITLLQFSLEGKTWDPRQALQVPKIPSSPGVVLSGKLARWAFAGLARYFATRHVWVGVIDPREGEIIVVASQDRDPKIGDVLSSSRLSNK